MRSLLTYGPGIPRYLAMWLPLTPLLVLGLVRFGVPRVSVAVVAVSTLPTFMLHFPPQRLPYGLRYAFLVSTTLIVVVWLARAARAGPPEVPVESGAHEVPARWTGRDWHLVAGLVVLTLMVRVPLAWTDPGIGDFATATQTAVWQLLTGSNPYTLPNGHATYGVYQYPAGTLLANLPFVALVPFHVLGELHVGARATAWATDAGAVLFLAWAGARLGAVRSGQAAAFAYAVHPTVVRESGIVVANDPLLALAVAAAALALTRRRTAAAALLVGVAISVKPAAVVLVPLLFVVAGWRAVLLAALPAVGLQLPFLLWPRPGLQGLAAILEPTARLYSLTGMRMSTWFPLYAVVGVRPWSVRLAAVVGVLAALAAAAWAGRQVRLHMALEASPPPARIFAAFALPLAVAFLLASTQRTNLQDWYMTCFLFTACTAFLAPAPAQRTPREAAFAVTSGG